MATQRDVSRSVLFGSLSDDRFADDSLGSMASLIQLRGGASILAPPAPTAASTLAPVAVDTLPARRAPTSSPVPVTATVEDNQDDDLTPLPQTAPSSQPKSGKIPVPTTLRAVWALVRNGDDVDQQKVALAHIAQLIERGAPDMSDVADGLFESLFHWIDRYRLPQFQSRRLGALLALAVQRPLLIVPRLIGRIYADQQTVADRLMALDVLLAAAQALACPPRASSSVGETQSETQQAANLTGVNNKFPRPSMFDLPWGRAMSAPATSATATAQAIKLTSQTRRFHAKRSPSVSSTAGNNAFSSVAGPLFFFPLVNPLFWGDPPPPSSTVAAPAIVSALMETSPFSRSSLLLDEPNLEYVGLILRFRLHTLIVL